jgi:hypothetical protein
MTWRNLSRNNSLKKKAQNVCLSNTECRQHTQICLLPITDSKVTAMIHMKQSDSNDTYEAK